MKKTWHYLENQFFNGTKRNFKRAVQISGYHDAHLYKRMVDNPADTDYDKCYNRYHVFHLALVAAYNSWKSKGGHQKGDTLNLIQLLDLLPAKVNKWDSMIQVVHEKGSPRYVQLFPHSHLPFYRGTQDTIIQAVDTLSVEIGSEVALAAVKALVNAAYSQLTDNKLSQEGSKEATDDGSVEVEAARSDAMVCMYQNLGAMMEKFPTQPDMIESLFDVENLCNPEQTIWRALLEPNEIHPTLEHTYEAGDMMRLKSIGAGGLDVYLSSVPGGKENTKVSIPANHELKFDVSEFGVTDYSLNRYLTIVNTSGTYETRFLLELY